MYGKGGGCLLPVSYTHLITVAKGDYLHGGDIIAEVPETSAIVHKCMVPPDVEGEVICCASDGEYRIEDTLVTLRLSDGTEKQLNMIDVYKRQHFGHHDA